MGVSTADACHQDSVTEIFNTARARAKFMKVNSVPSPVQYNAILYTAVFKNDSLEMLIHYRVLVYCISLYF